MTLEKYFKYYWIDKVKMIPNKDWCANSESLLGVTVRNDDYKLA